MEEEFLSSNIVEPFEEPTAVPNLSFPSNKECIFVLVGSTIWCSIKILIWWYMLSMSNHGETYHGVRTLHCCTYVIMLPNCHQLTNIWLEPWTFKISHHITIFKFILNTCYSLYHSIQITLIIYHIRHSIKTITLNINLSQPLIKNYLWNILFVSTIVMLLILWNLSIL